MGKWFRDYLVLYIKNNWLTYTLILVFFLGGVIYGSLGVRAMNSNQANELGQGFSVFLNQVDKTSISSWSLAMDVITKNLLIILTIYLLGLTIIGVPVIMVIIFTRGFRVGFTVGFLIQLKAAKGVLFTLASVLPQNLILIPVYIIAAATSIAFSMSLIRGRFANRTLSLSRNFIRYSLIMAVLAVMVITGGLFQSYVTPSLVKAAAIYLK